MLYHAFGATKSDDSKIAPTNSLPLKQVASYINEKVHDFSSGLIAKTVAYMYYNILKMSMTIMRMQRLHE